MSSKPRIPEISNVGVEGKLRRAYLIRNRDDRGEGAFLFILAFDDGFKDRGMVGSEVHEYIGDAGLVMGTYKLSIKQSNC